MGVCGIDREKTTRTLQQKYEITTREGVALLIYDYYYIAERRFHRADYAACNLLIDLDEAIDSAKLSKRQKQALTLHKERYTLEEAGEVLGITFQTFDEHLRTACTKVAKIFELWGNEDEQQRITE